MQVNHRLRGGPLNLQTKDARDASTGYISPKGIYPCRFQLFATSITSTQSPTPTSTLSSQRYRFTHTQNFYPATQVLEPDHLVGLYTAAHYSPPS